MQSTYRTHICFRAIYWNTDVANCSELDDGTTSAWRTQ